MLPFIQPKGGVDLAGATLGLDYGTTADYYVDGGVESSGNGLSVGTAFKTVQEAINAVAALTPDKEGDIAILNGTYRENPTFGSTAFTSDVGIRLRPYGTHTPTITAAEIITGWTRCDVSHSALIGDNYLSVFYKDIDLTDYLTETIDVSRLNVHENGEKSPLSHDTALDLNPYFLKAEKQWHVPTSPFGVDGSSSIVSVTDTNVLTSDNYADAQIENGFVGIWHGPNNISTFFNVDSSDIATNTLYITTNKPRVGGVYDDRWGLFNVGGAALIRGHWMYQKTAVTGNTFRVFLWPNHEANLTGGIEFSRRKQTISLASSTGKIVIEGLKIIRASGDDEVAGVNGCCIGSPGGDLSGTRKGPITIKNCYVGENWFADSGYGAINVDKADNVLIESNTITKVGNGTSSFNRACSNFTFQKNLVDTIGGSIINVWGSTSTGGNYSETVTVAFNEARNCGQNTHSNLMAFYTGCDGVLVYGNRINNSKGYLTWQESSNIFIAFNDIQLDTFDLVSPRAIADQTNYNGEPDMDSQQTILWNNRIKPRPGEETTFRNSLTLVAGNLICVAATTGNITLSGEQTIDGVSAVAGNSVLVWQQNDPIQNGVYTVAAGAWTRFAGSIITGSTMYRGLRIYVSDGSTYAATWWRGTNATNPVAGTDSVTFEQKAFPQNYVHNNLIHGGGVNRSNAVQELQLGGQEGNLYTAFTSGWTQGLDDLEASETYDATMTNTYVDTAAGNFRYTWGGNAGLVGVDFSAFIADLQARFPSFNFHQDMYGHPFDPSRPFIGPFNPKFRS